MLSAAMEDYLRAILAIQSEAERDRARTSQIAAHLGLSPASVTGMLRKLASMQPRLVDYRPYQGARLTPAGRRIALRITRHHRLLERFLTDALGLSWDQVHAEADRLEHALSETLEDHIDALLNHPRVDPHGDPIPTKEGELRPTSAKPLAQASQGRTYQVIRVRDEDPAMLRYLSQLGLIPGARLHVLNVAPFQGPLTIRIGASHHALAGKVLHAIFVREHKAKSRRRSS